jgi:hypothetical protein
LLERIVSGGQSSSSSLKTFSFSAMSSESDSITKSAFFASSRLFVVLILLMVSAFACSSSFPFSTILPSIFSMKDTAFFTFSGFLPYRITS